MSEAKSGDPFAKFQTIHLKKKKLQMAMLSMDPLYKVSNNTHLIISHKLHKIQFYTAKRIKIMQFAQ